MHLESICRPGGERPNEDAVASGADWGVVVDGASGLNPTATLGGGSAAAWLAQAFTSSVSRQFTRDPSTLNDIVACAHNEVRDAFAAQVKDGVHLDRLDRPSASAVVWWKRASTLEYFLIGDCTLLVSSEGKTDCVTDPRVARFDRVALEELTLHLQRGMSVTSAMAQVRPTLLANRARKNLPEGYWILEPADGWLQAALFGSLPIGEHGKLLACSDGFHALVEPFGVFGDHAQFLDAACAEDGLVRCEHLLLARSEEDSECRMHPRFKKCDDYSCVAGTW